MSSLTCDDNCVGFVYFLKLHLFYSHVFHCFISSSFYSFMFFVLFTSSLLADPYITICEFLSFPPSPPDTAGNGIILRQPHYFCTRRKKTSLSSRRI